MKKARDVYGIPQDASYDIINSPVGNLGIIVSKNGLHAILWDNNLEDPIYKEILSALKKSSTDKFIINTKNQLEEYFQGKRKVFDLPLVINGTDFQIQAWKQLQKIPHGETISYGEQAERMGDKKKARAVGMANGCNPISIVIPCHRVIGCNGHLTGFGGGLDKKEILLKLEQKC
jgi:methylated-DNA-[protein]-cysteine S-methyltransferase